MKDLAQKYGWTATGVYLALSAIDLPLCYLAVHGLGQERFVDYEMWIREKLGRPVPREETYVGKAAASDRGRFLAEFAVAYVLHKCLLVVRVPITISITPRVAEMLRRWGFNLTKGLPSVDKSVLAKKAMETKEAVTGAASASTTAAASVLKKEGPTSAGRTAANEITKEANKVANEKMVNKAVSEANKSRFGTPANKAKRWFAGFF